MYEYVRVTKLRQIKDTLPTAHARWVDVPSRSCSRARRRYADGRPKGQTPPCLVNGRLDAA